MQENELTKRAMSNTKTLKKKELLEDESPENNKSREKTANKQKWQNKHSGNKMKTETKLPKVKALSEDNKMVKNNLAEEETPRAAKWSNRELKDDTPKDDLGT